MPRFIENATDPSARTLNIYSSLQKKKINNFIENIRKDLILPALNSYLTFNLSN